MVRGKGLHHGEHLITSVALRPCELNEPVKADSRNTLKVGTHSVEVRPMTDLYDEARAASTPPSRTLAVTALMPIVVGTL